MLENPELTKSEIIEVFIVGIKFSSVAADAAIPKTPCAFACIEAIAGDVIISFKFDDHCFHCTLRGS